MYQHHWDAFQTFLRSFSIPSPSFPVSATHLAHFLVSLHDRGLSYGTIRTYVSAIAFPHKMAEQTDPTESFLIAKTLQGIKNQQSTRTSHRLLPITKNILHQLVDSLPFSVNDTYSRAMWKAIFLLTYHACLRSGEVVSSNNTDNIIGLHQVNLQLNSLFITFYKFKHSQGATPTLCIKPDQNTCYCPLQALRQYLQVRGSQPGFLFIDKHSAPPTRLQFAHLLKSTLTMTGHPAHRYNTHSFRIGRATQLASDNHSDATIRTAGRWHSSAYRRYIRPTSIVLPS